MVQRKPVSKPGIQAQTNGCLKLEMKVPSQYLENRSRAGCDLMKKMKKGRSFKHSISGSTGLRSNRPTTGASINSAPRKASPIKLSDGSSPNYMKPTSSSDARKESVQVSPKSRITVPSPGSKLMRLGSLKCKTVPGLKPTKSKSLNRSSSLKPVRPSMKKSSVVALHPKVNIVRPTCSSTLKDSKFPAYLDLDPGGTEVDGTSVMKVCPYTYCSLNGHYHEPLPPLKCFLSAKRRSLKTQKCLKLNDVSAPKREISGESNKEIDTGQIDDHGAPAVSPMIVDEGMNFFIEIYARPREEMKEPYSCDKEDGKPNQEESKPGVDDNIELDFSQSTETDSEMIIEDDINQTESYDTVKELTFSLDSYDLHEENEELVVENFLDLIRSDMEELGSNYSMDSDQEDWEERLSQYTGTEKTNSIILEEEESSEFGLPGMHEEHAPSLGGEEIQQLTDEDAESSTMEFDGDCDTFLDIVWIDEKEIPELTQSTEEAFDDHKEGKKIEDHEMNSEVLHLPEHDICDHIPEPKLSSDEAREFLVFEQDDYHYYHHEEKDQHVIPEDQNLILQIDAEQNPAADEVEEKINKSEDSCESHLDTVCEDQTLKSEQMEIEAENSTEIEADQSNSSTLEDLNSEFSDQEPPGTIHQASEVESDVAMNSEKQDGSEKDQTEIIDTMIPSPIISEKRCNAEGSPSNFVKSSGAGEDTTMEIEVSNPSSVNCESAPSIIIHDSSKPETETSLHANELYKRKSKRVVEENSGMLREFNPRAPRFLPLESDPDAEKVDLRHQMIDERKNAEEWMLDYALRKAVNQLGPARKRRVALLVEAFETVMPISQCDSRLQGATASFTHSMPIQACS